MPDRYRLPRTVTPDHYDIRLEPDLAAATFRGEAGVDVTVHEATEEVVLNAVELDIDEATVDGQPATVSYDGGTERATLRLASPLEPGRHRLETRFRGVLNDRLRGFYRSTFRDSTGTEHVIATTQFEATDARRAFPCWDEPDAKATFAVTLVVDDGLLAVSNGGEVGREPAGDGKVAVRFRTTMRMSTYLVAFVVGPLAVTDPVDVDGTPLRVVAPPERLHLAPFAHDVGAHALRYFADFFGIPYPSDKLDLVGIPDFAFGAMENLGCVTFRETALLADPATASQVDLQRVADVVNHEIAHMWFGDLVTMKWWNGIWLNEAFATFMELKATDRQFPAWDRWTSFGLERGAAFSIDSLEATRPIEFPVESPEEAEGMFDPLTYQKGCAVMRMLEQYVGEDAFRDGLRRYMRRHAHGNTETADLWAALEEASGDPVRAVMDTWILQGGHPVVTASLADDRATLVLEQARFRFLPDDGGAGEPRWQVPVLVRSPAGEHRVLVDGDRAELRLGDPVDWVVVNAGSSGFYRVRYSPDLLAALPLDDLSALERFTLATDTWAGVLAGIVPVAGFLDLARSLARFDDPDTWAALSTGLRTLARAADAGGGRDQLGAFVRSVAGPALERLGWEPVGGEPERRGVLRGTLVALLATVGSDQAVRERTRRLLAAYLDDRRSVAADLVEAVLQGVGAVADPGDFERVLERFRNPGTPQEEVRFLGALSGFDDPALYRRAVELYLSDEVRTQNTALVLASALARHRHGPEGWRLVRGRWDELTARIPSNSVGRMVGGLQQQVDPALLADARAFLAEHPVPQAAKQVAQTLELMEVHCRFAEREGARLADALGA